MKRFFDDIALGEEAMLGQHVFTAEDIKRYATRYDPQSFHVDEQAAKTGLFGALCASGWHTAMIWSRLMAQYEKRRADRQPGALSARPGPSASIRRLKWIKPVYVGDTITYRSRVAEKRESDARPGFGLVVTENFGVNQKQEIVISFFAERWAERRS